MHAFVELAEIRCQEILADANYDRLVRQARPIHPTVPMLQEKLKSTVRTARAVARNALGSIFFSAFRASHKERTQAVLTAAR